MAIACLRNVFLVLLCAGVFACAGETVLPESDAAKQDDAQKTGSDASANATSPTANTGDLAAGDLSRLDDLLAEDDGASLSTENRVLVDAGLVDAPDVDNTWLSRPDDTEIKAVEDAAQEALAQSDEEMKSAIILPPDDANVIVPEEVIDPVAASILLPPETFDTEVEAPDAEVVAAESALSAFPGEGVFDDLAMAPNLLPVPPADETSDLAEPFEDANFVPELDEEEDNADDEEEPNEDVAQDLMTVEDFESMDDQEIKFFAADPEIQEAGVDAIGPNRKITQKLFYPCTNKPCRLKKIAFITRTQRGPIRAIVVEKTFVYSAKRGARGGGLNLTKAFRKDADGKRGRAAWVFVVVHKKYRFKHGAIREVIRREYFENRKVNSSFDVVRVIPKPREGVKRIVVRKNFKQTGDDVVTTATGFDMALLDGTGLTKRTVVLSNDKRRTKTVAFTRANGIDTGTITGKDFRGRTIQGTFTLDHKANFCALNDVGKYDTLFTYPVSPSDPVTNTDPPKPVKERITIDVAGKVRTMEGIRTLSNDKIRKKSRVETTVKPANCAANDQVVKTTIVGKRYSGAVTKLTKVKWNHTVHVFGTITKADGTVQKVDYFRYFGIRVSKKFE